MANELNELGEILIVRITPQLLERDVLWYSENLAAIKKTHQTSPFWRDSSIILETGLAIKPSEVLRKITDFGYEKAAEIHGKGEFVWHGNLLEIWPINLDQPILIEFFGNAVAEIRKSKRGALHTGPKISHSSSINKLPEGSFVVHIDHGIGIFRGMLSTNYESYANMRIRKFEEDSLFVDEQPLVAKKFYIVEYASPRIGGVPDRLLVPEDQQKRLTPYIGFETPTIHRLGGTVWFTTRRKVKEQAENLAKDLYELYKKRAAEKREPYQRDTPSIREFDESFAYPETPDQKKATQDLDRDLGLQKPMDRIVCGDVGFGKTEIAMRAAFRAAIAGKQTALIAPTTILADQHLQTFTARFLNSGVLIAGLSRLTPKEKERGILKNIAEGTIDIVIGTHRLLSKDIRFKNLGLLIIDEEQKFGVRQKEHFKKIRGALDILTLSATPIPRTLSFAMARLRDMSLIQTPPAGRLPIKTYVLPYNPATIREAITAELERGGQTYFLHNRIETMGLFKEKLEKIIPRCRIRSVHGRMKENELLHAMREFQNKKFDLLLATTIIENGLDLESVNTLIVEDATMLGLAQAHQLRGRIGRADKQASAYFLFRPKTLTEKALERLEALQEYAELGSGYEIAIRDLEIRGAGNILGKEQSGAINKVGFNLYCQILNEAMEELEAQ
ncbi:MAG: DEAD/DEAH box helicase [Candidatus Sungbacteria bacterium]|nr:DEAD/DEAH box helicase [Candidatus Sungbacteria bacterium]